MRKASNLSKKSTITTRMMEKLLMDSLATELISVSFLHPLTSIKGLMLGTRKPQVIVNRSLSVDHRPLMTYKVCKSIRKCSNLSRFSCKTTFLSSRCLPLHLIIRWGWKVMRQLTNLIRVSVPYNSTPLFLEHTEILSSTWWKWARFSQARYLEGTL